MIRRLRLHWPDPRAIERLNRPLRLLAVSDERVNSLAEERNRVQLDPLDAVVGCGDLDPDYLAFLADAFRAPLLYVRGNHDRGGAWSAGEHDLPWPLDGRIERLDGIRFVGLSWPGTRQGRAERNEMAAWTQVLRAAWRAGPAARGRCVVLSHVPPSGLGDAPADPYHRGFPAYRWLCRVLRPPLWLHGHTAPPTTADWRSQWTATTLVNVTGAVLIELGGAPVGEAGTIGGPTTSRGEP